MKDTVSRRRRIVITVLLVAGVLAVFWPLAGSDFINYDDDLYVTGNRVVRQGLTAESLRWAWTTGYAANWHPLTWMSHLLDVSLFGLDPAGHHLSSLLLHALNAVLLFLVLEGMTGAIWRSAAVAALFAVHPLHVESVAWIAERKDVLSTTFWFLTMGAWARYAAAPAAARYLAVFVLLALGLTAKPMLVSLPFVLLLLDRWPLRRIDAGNWRRRVAEKIPLLGLALASSVVTVLVQRAGGAVRTVGGYPLAARLANAVQAYAGYLLQTVWPAKLAVFYPHAGDSIDALRLAASLALLTAITIAALRLRTRAPYVLLGWSWYLVTLLPVIGLVQVGEQAMADRYTYVPLIGIFIAVAWGVGDVAGRPRIAGGIAVAALAALSLAAHVQVRYWKDSETLFRHALRVTEDNYTAHLNLGLALADRGDLERAIGQYREALRLRPDHAGAHNNLGVALTRVGKGSEAVEHYREAIRLDPGNADARFNLGQALVAAGRIDAAMERFREAIRLDPDFVEAHYNYGTLLARQGRWQAAIEHLSRVVELRPAYAEAHYNLGLALYYAGDVDGARREVELSRRHGFDPPERTLELLGVTGR